MRKRLWSGAASVVLLAAAPILFSSPTVQAADTVTMGSTADPYAFKFFPAEITVPVGSTVVWQNLSDLQHDAVADNGAFKSELLNKNEKFEFRFTAPGDYSYICTPHKDAGMTGVIHVTGGGGTPTTVPTTPSNPGGTPGTTAPTAAGQPSTTTTTRAGSSSGPSSTTTTIAGGAGATSTTQAPSVTPTSGPDTAGETTTTTVAAHGGEESAATDHASEGGSEKKKKKNSPIGMAFASVSTLLLAAIAGKLLASKS
ncbi:MAG TPA: plastocyanin/azurin family copper-binding protein [Acidimicrobiia bacterium]|nr:plastocyanin/azurin family copper-binding protein [Acidimicrobiia bacterium]